MQHLDKGDKATASILQPKKVRKGAPGLNASEWSEKQADEDGLKSTRHLIRALDEDDGDLMKKIIMEERFCTTVGTDVGRRGLMHAEACKSAVDQRRSPVAAKCVKTDEHIMWRYHVWRVGIGTANAVDRGLSCTSIDVRGAGRGILVSRLVSQM